MGSIPTRPRQAPRPQPVGSSWFLEGLVVAVSIPVIAVLAKKILGHTGDPT